jgi:hypothetical protein
MIFCLSVVWLGLNHPMTCRHVEVHHDSSSFSIHAWCQYSSAVFPCLANSANATSVKEFHVLKHGYTPLNVSHGCKCQQVAWFYSTNGTISLLWTFADRIWCKINYLYGPTLSQNLGFHGTLMKVQYWI